MASVNSIDNREEVPYEDKALAGSWAVEWIPEGSGQLAGMVRVGKVYGHPEGTGPDRVVLVHEFRRPRQDGKVAVLRFALTAEACHSLMIAYIEHGLGEMLVGDGDETLYRFGDVLYTLIATRRGRGVTK